MASAITDDQILTKAWKLFYDVILANVTDPVSPVRTKWIFGKIHDKQIDKVGFPIIVIDHVESEPMEQMFGGNTINYMLSIPITVYSKKGLTANEVGDDIDNQLRTNIATLKANGVRNLNLDSVDAGEEYVAKELAHTYSLEYKFEYLVT